MAQVTREGSGFDIKLNADELRALMQVLAFRDARLKSLHAEVAVALATFEREN